MLVDSDCLSFLSVLPDLATEICVHATTGKTKLDDDMF